MNKKQKILMVIGLFLIYNLKLYAVFTDEYGNAYSDIMYTPSRIYSPKVAPGATIYYALHIDELAPTGDVKGHAYSYAGTTNGSGKVESTNKVDYQGGYSCVVNWTGSAAWAWATISSDWWDWKDLASTSYTAMGFNPNTDYLDFWMMVEGNYAITGGVQLQIINNTGTGKTDPTLKGSRGNSFNLPTSWPPTVGSGYCVESNQSYFGTWYRFQIPLSAFTGTVWDRDPLTAQDWESGIGFLQLGNLSALTGSVTFYFDNMVITRGQAARRDFDGDGILDSDDPDDDNDGISDTQDPRQFGEALDTDNDGIPDDIDVDDDNDLFTDWEETNGRNIITGETFTPTDPLDPNSRPPFNYYVTDTVQKSTYAPFNNPAMILTISIDDGDTPAGMENFYNEVIKYFYDRGYKVPVTYFFNSKNEQSKEILQEYYDIGCEIANHTHSHGIGNPFGVNIDDGHYLRKLNYEQQLTTEIYKCNQWLIQNINGLQKIYGFRAPFLSFNNDTMAALERLHFEYDASGNFWESPTTAGMWPFVMNPDPGGTVTYGWVVTPRRLWQIPVQTIDPNSYYPNMPGVLGEVFLAMNFDTTYSPGTGQVTFRYKTAEEIKNNQKSNFVALYNKPGRNRAPYHIHVHDKQLSPSPPEGYEYVVQGLKDFLIDILITNRANFPDVYVLTYHQLIEYTRGGKSIEEIVAKGPDQAGGVDRWAPAPPRNVSLSAKENPNRIEITWQDPIPKDSDFKCVRIYRSQREYELGSMIADNITGYNYTDTNIIAGITYYYTLRSVDLSGNESINTLQYSAFLAGTPPSTPPQLEIISPSNGQTYSGVLEIKCNVTDDVGITKIVYVIVNTTYTFTDQLSSPSQSYVSTWNLDTRLLANGEYTLNVTAYDTDGLTDSKQVTFNVFNVSGDTPPSVTIVSPANNATVSGTITISANVTDDNGIDKVEIIIDSLVRYTTSYSYPLPTNVNVSWQWDTTTVSNGVRSIVVKATDSMGQSGSATVSVNVYNEGGGTNNPPTVTIVQPSNNSTVYGNVVVGVNVEDDGVITKVEFYINNELKYTDTSEPYRWTWDTTSVQDGTYTIKVVATDNDGLTGEASVRVTVSNTSNNLPVIEFISPTNNEIISKDIVDIIVEITDDKGVYSAELYIDGNIQSGMRKEVNFYIWSWNTVAVSTGVHVLKVVAVDTDGARSEQQINVKVVRVSGNNPPSVVINSPTNNSTVSATITIIASASDTDGSITKVEFYVNQEKIYTDNTAPYEAIWDTTKYPDGEYVIRVVAFDNDNQTASSYIYVVVNNFGGMEKFRLKDKITLMPDADKNNIIDFTESGDREVVKVTIYSNKGEIVKVIEEGNFKWRGEDNNGKKVPAGVYIYQLEEKGGKIKIGTILVVR